MIDSAVLTTLVDRWHPEAHTFHLLCGETTVSIQDFTMILCLPIDCTPVSGMVSPGRWRDSVAAAIVMRPPDVLTDQKGKKTMGIHSGWLTGHFDTCPKDVEDAVIQRYARSCLWHMNDE
jgi:hypothetical protein